MMQRQAERVRQAGREICLSVSNVSRVCMTFAWCSDRIISISRFRFLSSFSLLPTFGMNLSATTCTHTHTRHNAQSHHKLSGVDRHKQCAVVSSEE